MSKATGVALIVSGVAMAAYMLPEGDTSEPEIAVSRTDVATNRIAEAPTAQTAAAPVPRPTLRPVPPARTADAGAPVVVTVAQRPGEGSPVFPRVSVPRNRDALVRELQKELRRVGCYDGEIHGVWTPATRRAMKAFLDRANASLPVDEPDAILYAMVQGQAEQMCSEACPAGEGLSEDGRCVPAVLLARGAGRTNLPSTGLAHRQPAEHRPASVITGWTTTSTPAQPPPGMATPAPQLASPPTEGRMALAGPVTEETPGPPPNAGPVTPQAVKPPKPPRSQSWAAQVLSRRDSQFSY
jgi:hypothetical protein